MRKRKGEFARYSADSALDLVGIINCPGCPTTTGTQKLMQRIRALTEFRIDAIHLTYCLIALCPFKEKYVKALAEAFPQVEIVRGTHESHITYEQFRKEVGELFNQPQYNMVDLILGRHKPGEANE
jgi:predicted metal-binding protein